MIEKENYMNSDSLHESRHYSKGGLIAAGLTLIIPIIGYIRVSGRTSAMGALIVYTTWIIPIISMVLRSFSPPLSWKKGIATWFGSALLVAAVNQVTVPLYDTGTLQYFNVTTTLPIAAIGAGLVFIGFRK
jgi:hypothetical protein